MAQHVVQHPAVLDVLDLDGGIDPAPELDRPLGPVGVADGAGHHGERLQIAREPRDRDRLVALQPERPAVVAVGELERDHPHADEVRAMDALEALGDHRLDPEQRRALRRPVARRAGAVFDAADDDERHPALLPGHRRVEDRGLLAVRPEGVAALDPVEHLVADADVGEGAAHHHLVVAAPRAVGVEVPRVDLPLGQILAGRRRRLERAGGRDVVGRDHVAEQREDARPREVGDDPGLPRHALEVGRVLDVGRGRRPVVGLAVGGLDRAPVLVALEDVGVLRLEGPARHRRLDELGDLLVRRPDVLQEDGIAVPVRAERLAGQVDVDVAGERIGDDERRAGEIVRPHVRVDRGPRSCGCPTAPRSATRSLSAIALEIAGRGSGPELPMQVVQP